MAPMITDSYYNDMDFGNSNTSKYLINTSNKPPLPSISYSMNDQQKIADPGYSFGFRRAYTEDAIIDILREIIKNISALREFSLTRLLNNSNLLNKQNIFKNFLKKRFTPSKNKPYCKICDLLEELIVQCLNDSSDHQILNIKNLDQFYSAFGHLLTNTISNEVQRLCVKFLQSYFKIIDKLKHRRKTDPKINEKFKQIDLKVSSVLIDYLILSSVSPKLQLKTFSIDLIYSYMRLTDDVNGKCFEKFIKIGIENPDPKMAKQFIDPTLGIFFTSEFQHSDYSSIIKSLTNKLPSPLLEQSALNCLNKLENLLKKDKFVGYINKLPLTNRNNYLDATNQIKSSIQFKNQSLVDSLDKEESMKFNLIPARILQKLSGEDELQRLKAINSLEQSVQELTDIKTSKTIRQALTSMMITAIERMSSPVLILEALLEKVRDRSAKTREDTLNLVIACVLRFPNDKFESLRKIFFLVSPLLCDIKRSVRHASLECLAIILNRLKQIVNFCLEENFFVFCIKADLLNQLHLKFSYENEKILFKK
ncbi:hypothetical protein BpHYR1_050754 [Brachionus plicatilis]|uniref:TOG domain-containing protein n=1 Tax=Brachionus plicatilis TaxID=10195 RepID=A0A3M7P9E8_BRAPC|nr:hypothetical protein BpHYR1_050754 [Brachionus plicatilis]